MSTLSRTGGDERERSFPGKPKRYVSPSATDREGCGRIPLLEINCSYARRTSRRTGPCATEFCGVVNTVGGPGSPRPLRVETFTGLRTWRFERRLKVVRERGGNGPGGGRPWCPPPADRVLPGGRPLPREPHHAAARAAVRRLAGDGRPAVDRGRHPRPGPRPQDRGVLTRPPVLGEGAGRHRRRHEAGHHGDPADTTDAKAWRDYGPAAVREGAARPGDGAYLATGLAAPHRERPGRAPEPTPTRPDTAFRNALQVV